MPQLPTPFRAAIGLVATALDEARSFPDRAIELPMLAVSTALQMSLRAQQRYAALAARGEELLNRSEPTDEPPTWARFDEPGPMLHAAPPLTPTGRGRGAGTVNTADPAETLALVEEVTEVTPPPARTGAKAAAKTAPKTVRRPRNSKPSAFDIVGDQ